MGLRVVVVESLYLLCLCSVLGLSGLLEVILETSKEDFLLHHFLWLPSETPSDRTHAKPFFARLCSNSGIMIFV